MLIEQVATLSPAEAKELVAQL
eukprot:SAG25_NODE_8597_length_414_cov_0.933333_1_plen_21_part_10